MWKLYLLSRIGIISTVATVACVLLILTSIICYIISITVDAWDGKDVFNEWQQSKLRKFAKRLLYMFCITLPISILTPTTKEAYLIYGVGSTLDYLQSNNKAKELPDKCIDALNAWVESLNKED